MGISIKRHDTERLARQIAMRRGEGLTETIHHALQEELTRLDRAGRTTDQIEGEMKRLFARLDSLGPGNGKSLQEIEAEMYGELGEPV